jgi:thymidylate synthase
MHLTTRNVNTAFRDLVGMFARQPGSYTSPGGTTYPTRRESRNGPVLVIDEPVTITYTHPTERVLLNPHRDCNPFFHMYEALWMLAGRNDVAPLSYYNSRMKNFSDDGKTLNGAYGYRWRHAGEEDVDQLEWIIKHLKGEPASRRAVLNMWTVDDDLMNVGFKLMPEYKDHKPSKDVCCNLNIMFSLREADEIKTVGGPIPDGWTVDPINMYLDMTVTNRSNDLVWGLLGANYVHFSILQEYMAAQLGVRVGKYHHFTNNLHVYCDRPDWQPEKFLQNDQPLGFHQASGDDWQGWYRDIKTIPLKGDIDQFDEELPEFVEAHAGHEDLTYEPKHPFLRMADHMLMAWRCRKKGDMASARLHLKYIESEDWKRACLDWFNRREK